MLLPTSIHLVFATVLISLAPLTHADSTQDIRYEAPPRNTLIIVGRPSRPTDDNHSVTKVFVGQKYCHDYDGKNKVNYTISHLKMMLPNTLRIARQITMEYKIERVKHAKELKTEVNRKEIIPTSLFPANVKKEISRQDNPLIALLKSILNTLLKTDKLLELVEIEDGVINKERFDHIKLRHQLARLKRVTDHAGLDNMICALYQVIDLEDNSLTIDDLTVKPLLTQSELDVLRFLDSTHRQRRRRSVTRHSEVRTYFIFEEFQNYLKRMKRLVNRMTS